MKAFLELLMAIFQIGLRTFNPNLPSQFQRPNKLEDLACAAGMTTLVYSSSEKGGNKIHVLHLSSMVPVPYRQMPLVRPTLVHLGLIMVRSLTIHKSCHTSLVCRFVISTPD